MELTEKDVKGFLNEGSYSSTTKRYYGHLLNKFMREGGELAENSVRKFIGGYKVKRSGNTARAVLRSLAKWKRDKIPPVGEDRLMQRFELEKIMGIKGSKIRMRLERKELSTNELMAVFGNARGIEFSGLWSLAWFGTRPGELVELKLSDINKKPDDYLPVELAKELGKGDYCVKFLTEKTKVERAVFMDGFTRYHLENFIRSGRGYSFLRNSCIRLHDKAGVKFTPKWFRSTFQTKMQRGLVESGVPTVRIDLLVKVMSGHTVSQDITGVYTDFGTDILKAMTEHHYLKPLEKELNREG